MKACFQKPGLDAMKKLLLLGLEIYKGFMQYYKNLYIFFFFGIFQLLTKVFQSHSLFSVTSSDIIQEMSNDITTRIIGGYHNDFAVLCSANSEA